MRICSTRIYAHCIHSVRSGARNLFMVVLNIFVFIDFTCNIYIYNIQYFKDNMNTSCTIYVKYFENITYLRLYDTHERHMRYDAWDKLFYTMLNRPYIYRLDIIYQNRFIINIYYIPLGLFKPHMEQK